MAPESADGAQPLRDEASRRRISERIAARSLSLMIREFQRTPVPTLCADAFIAYLAYQVTKGPWPWVWFAVAVALQLFRYALARRLSARPPQSAEQTLERLIGAVGIIGATKASILPVFFFGSEAGSDEAFLVTMVITGLAAGGVASVAGTVRAMLAWGSPLFFILVIGWVLHGGVFGIAVALLLCLLFAVLLAYVRDQHKMIEELVTLVDDREVLSVSLQRERDRAQSASAAKTRFFAAASHDLRQPLHALAINATTLGFLAKRMNIEILRNVSRGIDGALSQSQSLLDGLLDISRLDARAIEAHLTTVDMSAVLRTVKDEYEALAAQKGLQIHLHNADSPHWAMTDPDQMNRVVGNLVSNAVKFTQRGSITLTAGQVPGFVTLQVADTGQGIPPGEHEMVFEEFYQGGNPSRDRAQGLGLGLAIVKRTCDLLTIELSFESRLQAGTTFELKIPAAEGPPTYEEPSSRDFIAEEVVFTGPHAFSALVIDDEAQVLESVERHLVEVGWAVRSGASGLAAEAAIEEGFRPDVLVVDYRLRHETGLDVIARVRRLIPALPAVIVTGDTGPQRLRELSAQANNVLHKPLDGVKLVNALIVAIKAREGAPG